MSVSRRLPRHVALLVLAVALALVPGLPDSVPSAVPADLAGRATEPVMSIPSPIAAADPRVTDSAALTVEPADGAQPSTDDDDRAVRSNARPQVIPAMAASRSPDASPRWSGAFNLYRKTAFVTQRDFKWCVAASVQMMVNFVRHTKDRTAATQKRMIAYAQATDDGPYGPGGGTDVTGWIAALRHFGAGKYRAVGTRTAGAALRIAATAMRQTGRPAGMLVMEGRHAWILHGFESRTDPRSDSRAKITSVRVSGPLYPIQQKNGYDLRPNTELSVPALVRYFQPSSVGALVGKYVVIVPVH